MMCRTALAVLFLSLPLAAHSARADGARAFREAVTREAPALPACTTVDCRRDGGTPVATMRDESAAVVRPGTGGREPRAFEDEKPARPSSFGAAGGGHRKPWWE